jgi:hypothetical protein
MVYPAVLVVVVELLGRQTLFLVLGALGLLRKALPVVMVMHVTVIRIT